MNKWRKLDSLGYEREFDVHQIHFRGTIRASGSRGGWARVKRRS
ncbi:hypothetical protein V6Z12_D02G100600 [Gossypium hirsutum]